MIGHGGFGITYRAFDTQLAKVVAIKEYLPIECAIRHSDGAVVPRGARLIEDFTWGRERFLDEARALARFRHPHIVPVLRYFEANDTAYTVMEFEDGKTVAELLRDPGRRLPADDVRRLAERVAERPRGRTCPGLPASRHQAGEHHHPARQRSRSRSISARRGRRWAAAPARSPACSRRNMRRSSNMPSTASRAPGATSIPPPPSSITRSRDRRRLTRPRASARIPIGRWPRWRTIASNRRSWPRSTTRWPSRRTIGRRALRHGERCSAPRCPGSRMHRRNALPTARASRRRAWARPAAKGTRLPCRRRGARAARGSGSPWS